MSIQEINKSAIRREKTILTLVLLICFSLSWAIQVQARVLSPETYAPYTASILNNEYKARVGEPFFILLRIDPVTLPPGYSVSTLVDVLESPDGIEPQILTGFPKIRLTMMRAGSYRIAVRITLVTKSSCGGIDAEEILRKELILEASHL